MCDERKIYGFITKDGEHVNLMPDATWGNPIQPVYDDGGVEPCDVQYFDNASQADWYRHSLRERCLEYAEDLDKLSITWLTQSFLDTGNYQLVKAVCD